MPLTPAERYAALTPDEQAAALAAYQRAATAPAPAAPDLEPDEPAGNAWAELDDFYDETLQLSTGGRRYELHAVDVKTGLLCQRLVNLGLGALTDYNLGERALRAQEGTEDTLDDSTEEYLYRRLLGGDREHPGYRADWDVWQQLIDNGAPWPLLRHMGVTALMWAGRDRSTALTYWLDGARPKALLPGAPEPTPPTPPRTPQDRRPSAREAAGSGTKPRASTSGTKPRKSKGTPGSTS